MLKVSLSRRLFELYSCSLAVMSSGDMWTQKDEADEEPDWVKEERNQFASFRDKNNDGIMDRQEVRDWIIPEDYDHADSEAKHLIHEADKNQVGTVFSL